MRKTIALFALLISIASGSANAETASPWLVYNPFYGNPVRASSGVKATKNVSVGVVRIIVDAEVTQCAISARLADNTPGRRIGVDRVGSTSLLAYVFTDDGDFVDAPFDLLLRCAPAWPIRRAK